MKKNFPVTIKLSNFNSVHIMSMDFPFEYRIPTVVVGFFSELHISIVIVEFNQHSY